MCHLGRFRENSEVLAVPAPSESGVLSMHPIAPTTQKVDAVSWHFEISEELSELLPMVASFRPKPSILATPRV